MTELSQRLSENENDAVALEKRKQYIASWRYRVYIFIIAVIIMAIEPMFTQSVKDVRGEGAFSINILDPVAMFTKVWSWWKLNELSAVQQAIDDTVKSIENTKLQIEIVKNLETTEKQNTILNCVNDGLCDTLWTWLVQRMDLLRSFILVEHLSSNKTSFDQKFVLRNINEFLANQPWRWKLVDINRITFSAPVEVHADYKLFKVPVVIDISYFVNIDFMTFLRNIETKASPNLPVMWRIESINYDIVNYLKAQDVSLTMWLYYIHTEDRNKLVQAQDASDTQHASAE